MSSKLVKKLLQNTSSHESSLFKHQHKQQPIEKDHTNNKKRKIRTQSKHNDPHTSTINSKDDLLKNQIQALLEMDQALLSSGQKSQTTLLKLRVKDKRKLTKLRQKIHSKNNKHAGNGNSRSSCSSMKLKHEITITKEIGRSQKKLKTIRDISRALS